MTFPQRCKITRRFMSRRDAQQAGSQLRREGHGAWQVYQCGGCGLWHIRRRRDTGPST